MQTLFATYSKLIIKTNRLELRPFKTSDYDSWVRQSNGRRKKQNRFDRRPTPKHLLGRKYYNAWLKKMNRLAEIDCLYTFGIFEKKSGDCVGTVNFTIISRLKLQFANTGYEVSNQYWGNGYAVEALKALTGPVMRILKLHRIEAGIEPDNTSSIKVAKRVGMNREGIRKKYIFDGKRWIDLVYFMITAEDVGIKKCKPVTRSQLADYLT